MVVTRTCALSAEPAPPEPRLRLRRPDRQARGRTWRISVVVMIASVCASSGCVFLPPFYVEGPGYKVVPPVLSGRWRGRDGSDSVWITPLYHHTREADGRLRHMHALNYFAGRDYSGLFPLWYSRRPTAGRPALFSVLGGLLWYSHRPARGKPARFSVLGGLFQRTCNYERGTYTYRFLWFIPFARRRFFEPERERQHAREREVVAPPREPAEEDVPELIRALRKEGRKGRRSAAASLGEMGPAAAEFREAVPALVEALGDVHFDVRRSAAEALARIGPAVVPALIRALEDPESKVRWCAAYALGETGPAAREAVAALTRALEDPDPNVRSCAEQALEKIRAE